MPENKTINPFTDIPYLEMPTAAESDNGEFLNNLRTLNVGDGAEGFRMDKQGIWLGALLFADAPFSVSMAGAVNATSFTLSGGTITGGTIQTAASRERIVLSGNKLVAYNSFDSPLFELLGSANEPAVVKYYSNGDRKAMYLFESTDTTADLIYCEMGGGSGKAIHIINGKNSTGNVDIGITTGVGILLTSAGASANPSLWIRQLDLDKTAVVIADNLDVAPQNEAILEVFGTSTSSAMAALLYLLGNTTSKQAAIRMGSIGGNPSSPLNGDIWFDGTNLHMKINGTIYHVDMTAE